VFNALGVVFVYYMCPEVSSNVSNLCLHKFLPKQTTGKTLEEIDSLFARDTVVGSLPPAGDNTSSECDEKAVETSHRETVAAG
jgi:hypothetical protein